MSNADTTVNLPAEHAAWLRANASSFDFERWQEGSQDAPWYAQPYGSVLAMKAGARSAGSHFFDPATMRFFHSKIETAMLHGGRFFVTSEYREDPAEKRYSVRWAITDPESSPSWEANGLEFQQFATLAEAKAAALILAGICADVLAATNSQEG